MAVHVDYLGRWGNWIFQYACARLFSEKNGLQLLTSFPKCPVFNVLPAPKGVMGSGQEQTLSDMDDLFGKTHPPGRYLLRGFFQNATWFLGEKKKIESFMRPKAIGLRNSRDFAIHLRLTDFKAMKWCISPSWYLDILGRERFEKLYIFTDERDPEHLNAFSKFNPTVCCGDPFEDWQKLRTFDRMAISTSTYAWWAAFFSPPSRLYLFDRYPFGFGLGELPGAIRVPGKLTHEGLC